ncbi:Hypothetical predicted protein [Scomber scombrus]|uniref:Uncharacterized protein n=1 Tax=Scomber scombrus TaxID=13677 RepID=A0AAV1PBA6_SCOSC
MRDHREWRQEVMPLNRDKYTAFKRRKRSRLERESVYRRVSRLHHGFLERERERGRQRQPPEHRDFNTACREREDGSVSHRSTAALSTAKYRNFTNRGQRLPASATALQISLPGFSWHGLQPSGRAVLQ